MVDLDAPLAGDTRLATEVQRPLLDCRRKGSGSHGEEAVEEALEEAVEEALEEAMEEARGEDGTRKWSAI